MRKAIALMALALGACGDGAPETGNVTAIAPANDYDAQLKALSESSRGLAMRRAIQDSGSACKRVDAVAYQEAYRNMAMWTARCSDSGDWAVFLAPNGDVQVRKCSDGVQLGLPQCRFAASAPGS